MKNQNTQPQQAENKEFLLKWFDWAKQNILYSILIVACAIVAVVSYTNHANAFTVLLFACVAIGGVVAGELKLRDQQKKLEIYEKRFGPIPEGYDPTAETQ